MQRITTFLTFTNRGQEAVEFYTTVFKNSKIHSMMAMPDGGQLMHASFSLDGQEFMAMDGGETFQFKEGVSLFVTCHDQTEVDYYWDTLTADGGAPGRCGWLKDKFGMSWQIVPTALGELMSGSDRSAADRVMQAMLAMDKIEIVGLEQAAQAG